MPTCDMETAVLGRPIVLLVATMVVLLPAIEDLPLGLEGHLDNTLSFLGSSTGTRALVWSKNLKGHFMFFTEIDMRNTQLDTIKVNICSFFHLQSSKAFPPLLLLVYFKKPLLKNLLRLHVSIMEVFISRDRTSLIVRRHFELRIKPTILALYDTEYKED